MIGAGFSKAVSEIMPTIAELGEEVFSMVDSDAVDARYRAGNFEDWLSFAAGEAPWLFESERLALRSVFLEASEAVKQVIELREFDVRQESMPDWLAKLVVHWHETET